MLNFYVRLVDRDGSVHAEKMVECDRLEDLWAHAGDLAQEGSAGDRLHLIAEGGMSLATMGVRTARMLASHS
jgi:hypothetical protein